MWQILWGIIMLALGFAGFRSHERTCILKQTYVIEKETVLNTSALMGNMFENSGAAMLESGDECPSMSPKETDGNWWA